MKLYQSITILLFTLGSFILLNTLTLYFSYEQTLHENPSSYLANVKDEKLSINQLIQKKSSAITYELWESNRDVYKWMFFLTLLYISLVIVVFLSLQKYKKQDIVSKES